jgi:hypothetical protein
VTKNLIPLSDSSSHHAGKEMVTLNVPKRDALPRMRRYVVVSNGRYETRYDAQTVIPEQMNVKAILTPELLAWFRFPNKPGH